MDVITKEDDVMTPKVSVKTLRQELEETGSMTFGSEVSLDESTDISEHTGRSEDDEDDEDDEAQAGCSGFDDIDFEMLTCQMPGLVQAKVSCFFLY